MSGSGFEGNGHQGGERRPLPAAPPPAPAWPASGRDGAAVRPRRGLQSRQRIATDCRDRQSRSRLPAISPASCAGIAVRRRRFRPPMTRASIFFRNDDCRVKPDDETPLSAPSMTARARVARPGSAGCARALQEGRDRPAWSPPRYERRQMAATAPRRRVPTPRPSAGTSRF